MMMKLKKKGKTEIPRTNRHALIERSATVKWIRLYFVVKTKEFYDYDENDIFGWFVVCQYWRFLLLVVRLILFHLKIWQRKRHREREEKAESEKGKCGFEIIESNWRDDEWIKSDKVQRRAHKMHTPSDKWITRQIIVRCLKSIQSHTNCRLTLDCIEKGELKEEEEERNS